MAEKLLGKDDAAGEGTICANYFILNRYQAVASGSMTLFYLRSANNGNIKVAIYADDGGEPPNPAAVITAMNTGQAVGAGWVSVTFTSTDIVKDSYYWLGYITDATIVRFDYSGVRRYKVATYAGFTFPDSPTGLTSDTYGSLTAGWGTIPSAFQPWATLM